MDSVVRRASPRRRHPERGPRFLASLLLAFVFAGAFGCGNSGDPFGVLTPETKVPILVTSPADDATGVSVNTLVTVAFPLDLDTRTVHPGSFVLLGPTGFPVPRAVSYDASSRVVTIRPDRPLDAASLYQLTVQGVRSTNDVPFAPLVTRFGTGPDSALDGPEVIGVTPVPDQANVNVDANIVISFSRPMDQPSVVNAFSISDGISGTISFDAAGMQMTFDPAGPMPLGTLVRIQITRDARDRNGIPLRVGFDSSFSTPGRNNFKIVRSVPANGAATAGPSTLLFYTFSEPVNRSTVATNFEIAATGLAIPLPTDANFSYSNNDQVVIYDPAEGIANYVGFPGGSMVRTTFNIGILSAISGVGLERPFRSNFTVEAFPPQVTATVPLNGQADVDASQEIRFTFSEPLNPATVNATTFQVTQGPVVPGTISLVDGDRTIVFVPTNPYQNAGVPVNATANTGITDRGGTPLAAAVTVAFSIDTQPPFISTQFPNPAQQDVPVTLFSPRNIQVRFNEDLDQAATSMSFMISPDASGGVVAFSDSRTLVYTPPVMPMPVEMPTPPNQRLLTGATDYTVSFTAFDLASNQTAVSFNFRTDDDPPVVVAASPTAMGQSPVATVVSVTFNEIMNEDTLQAAVLFRRVLPTAVDIPVTPATGDTGFSLSFGLSPMDPPALDGGATYELTVQPTATDLGGVALQAPFTLLFQTM